LLSAAGLDFESGLAGWEQTSSSGSVVFFGAPIAGRSVATCNLSPGTSAQLVREWAPAELGAALPFGSAPGRRLSAEFELWLGDDVGPGELTLRLSVNEGGIERELSAATLDTNGAPRNRWFRWSTGVASGGLASSTTSVRLECTLDAPGEVRIDEGRLGLERPSRYPDLVGDFESGAGAWITDSASQAGWTDEITGGYRGTGCARLSGNTAWIEHVTAIDGAPGGPRLQHIAEAGAWLRVDDGALLGNIPSAADEVRLVVRARNGFGGTGDAIAEAHWQPRQWEMGRWVYLETTPLGSGAIPLDAVELVVTISSNIEGVVRVDDVALGEQASVDGNPVQMVGCNYVGRYRSPLYPLGAGNLGDAGENWRNWRWVAPPAPDANHTGFAHDPECGTSTACFRTNGRRDLAIGTELGDNVLPLIGAYDSRDDDVLRYHAELAEALGVDFFIYDYLGHSLAVQNELQGREALNEESFESLLDALDDPARSLKVAPMYEPKVHMQGWVGGEPSLFDKKNGIYVDLLYYVEQHGNARGSLRRNGQLVVFLFRDRSCNGNGSQCLVAGDWAEILDWVEWDTGERLFLLADSLPTDGSPFGGMSRWDLVSRSFLRYRTFDDAAAGTPTTPAPDVDALALHSAQRHDLGRDWALADPRERLHVPIVWPGFDDTGVAGWGMNNLNGEDGAPLGVRVADPLGGAFYRTTIDSAVGSGADWVQIATWNDWNEGTRIEPAYDPRFVASPFLSLIMRRRVSRHVFGRAFETQAWIAEWKGTTAQPARVPRIAMRYLIDAAQDPVVTQYD